MALSVFSCPYKGPFLHFCKDNITPKELSIPQVIRSQHRQVSRSEREIRNPDSVRFASRQRDEPRPQQRCKGSTIPVLYQPVVGINQPRVEIQMIVGGNQYDGRSGRERRRYARAARIARFLPTWKRLGVNLNYVRREEAKHVLQPHSDALIITMLVVGANIHKTLVAGRQWELRQHVKYIFEHWTGWEFHNWNNHITVSQQIHWRALQDKIH
ncbi:Uncharacterized protein Fot_27522 [Forsythia ovata]|uniref:Uncharacterized protein n=1 Tax=Forsythia ovata TaxID=205694 RepID=A0ABD1TLF0_9LAMI